eukprot:TRINITY_DN39151_c0_g1_i1.p1 TRINITY_DN39151_c0_g1~~TRINITY_DN39151_c0_g1_i1.p1  ORF type:complete len:621 (-),score=120.19 TRINITY_DN39151_c0_g1_i1:277-2139(-)
MACRLEVRCDSTRHGDLVMVAGASEALGAWEVPKGVKFQTDSKTYPVWCAPISLQVPGTEFKFVIRRSDGRLDWEPVHPNRRWPSAEELAAGSTLRANFGERLVTCKAEAKDSESPMAVSDSPSSFLRCGRKRAANLESPSHVQFISDNRGRIADLYDRGRSIGVGAFSSVYVATSRRTGHERAVKEIHKVRLGDLEQLKQEVDIMKMMDHPSIIKLIEYCEDEKNMYLVMDLCTGGDLFERIVQTRQMSEAHASVILRQILAGVRYMHEQGICHRDIKPENFLFLNKGPIEDNTVKIIDFGLSCTCKPGQVLHTRLGTPSYVAPEVLTGEYGQRADLWGCGVILHILLCGSPPFDGKTDMDILEAVKIGNVTFASRRWKNVTDAAQQLVKRLLTLDPEQRCSASEALSDSWLHLSPSEVQQQQSVQMTSEDLLGSLRAYRSMHALRKAALQIIAWRYLTEDKIKDLKETFVSLDKNGDGVLSIEELGEALKAEGVTRTPAELREIVAALDPDCNGSINYTDFVAAMIDKRSQNLDSAFQSAFSLFDKDGDGKLSQEELYEVLDPEGFAMEGSDASAVTGRLASLIAEVDKDGDGKVDFEEFVQLMKSNACGADASVGGG